MARNNKMMPNNDLKVLKNPKKRVILWEYFFISLGVFFPLDKHRDYASAFLQDLIIVKRNNSIASLQKAVVNTDNAESK